MIFFLAEDVGYDTARSIVDDFLERKVEVEYPDFAEKIRGDRNRLMELSAELHSKQEEVLESFVSQRLDEGRVSRPA